MQDVLLRAEHNCPDTIHFLPTSVSLLHFQVLSKEWSALINLNEICPNKQLRRFILGQKFDINQAEYLKCRQ